MNNFFFKIKTPFEFKPVFPTTPLANEIYSSDHFQAELKNWLASKNLEIEFAEYFYLSPHTQHEHVIHLDGTQFDDHAKLNFVMTDSKAHMQWWSIQNHQALKKYFTPSGHPYLTADMKDCVLQHSACLSGAYIVNAGQLHSVSRVECPRFCFSFKLRFTHMDRQPVAFSFTHDLFKNEKV